MRLIGKLCSQKMKEAFLLWLMQWGMPFWITGGITATQIGNLFLEIDARKTEAIYEVNYQETLNDVENPGRGFYAPLYVHFREENTQIPDFRDKLLHLRMDLVEFSGAYNQKGDIVLSNDMLNAFDRLLSNMEKKQCTGVLRFSYDPNFSGTGSYEPSMEMMLMHQKQLGEVISRHEEAVVSVECGLFGKWGEMHDSAACSQENFKRAIDQWLEVLPQSIPISVRTPLQYCEWCGVPKGALSAQVTEPGQKEYRVGIYDDAYLGSETDLGTYENREEEVKWLSNQARHTLFGGEAGAGGNPAGGVGFSISFLEKEAFMTHTSYLNIKWNQSVIDALRKEIYSGKEERYRGSDGYVFLRNHMGYRFVLRGVSLTKEIPSGRNLVLDIDVENVGFANLVKPKELTVILSDADKKWMRAYSAADFLESGDTVFENCDPTKWNSKEISKIHICIPISEDIPLGTYQVYLRIAGKNQGKELKYGSAERGYPVRFANDDKNIFEKGF